MLCHRWRYHIMMDVIVIVCHLLIPPISSYRMEEGGVRIEDGGCLRVVWRYPIDRSIERDVCVDGPSIEYAANAMSRSVDRDSGPLCELRRVEDETIVEHTT